MAVPIESINLESLYRMRKSHRVVVTGVGAISALGLNMKDTFQGLINGKTGIQKISTSEWELKEDARNSEVDIAGLVMNFDASQYIPKKELNRIHRSAQFSVIASREALIQAGLFDPSSQIEKGVNHLLGVNPHRFGVILGTGIGGGSVIAEMEDTIRDKGDKRVSSLSMLHLLPERVSTVPSIWFGAEAEVGEKTAACASAPQAISDAFKTLERGDADCVLTGGAEAANHRIALAGFNNMHALNNQWNKDPEGASRPFDQKANGFVMGEGAGILLLETLEHAVARGATILAELVGFSNTADAYHDTAPNQRGAERAMRLALVMAEIDPSEVDYINAHGTSTPLNDPMELSAIKEVYKDKLRAAISSTKGATGHLLGAAGGLEAAICVQTIQEGIIPPTVNLHSPIKEAEGLNLVPLEAQRKPVNVAVSHSLGFGGLNSVLVFRRFPQNTYQESKKR